MLSLKKLFNNVSIKLNILSKRSNSPNPKAKATKDAIAINAGRDVTNTSTKKNYEGDDHSITLNIFDSAHNQNDVDTLDNIITLFQKAQAFICATDNDNLKWHQGIECLKMVEKLSENLVKNEQQRKYVIEYINTGYAILGILQQIDSYKFFYGVKEYFDKDDADLYQESSRIDSSFTYRINPDDLIILNAFIEKAGQASHDANNNDIRYETIFLESYFQKKIKACKMPFFNKVHKIDQYINSFKTEEVKQLS